MYSYGLEIVAHNLQSYVYVWIILTRLRAGGGGGKSPPLGFFKKPRKRRKIWTQKKISVYQIHFPRFKKKSHVICFSRFATVITFSTWVGGGENHPPPIWAVGFRAGGGWFWPPPSNFFVYWPRVMKFSHMFIKHKNSSKNIFW